jgi:anti-sigma factor RsiW
MARECSKINGWMDEALDGELTPAAAKRFREHLAACAGCRRDFDALRTAAAALAAAPRPAPSATFTADVLRKARAAKARAKGRRRAASWTLAGAAAAAAAAVVGGWLFAPRPGVGRAAGAAVASLASAFVGAVHVVGALQTPLYAAAKLLSALATVAARLAAGAVAAGSPAYVGAFAAIAAFYLIWRFGLKGPAPATHSI